MQNDAWLVTLASRFERMDEITMGKVLAFVLAAADLAVFAVLILPRQHDVLADAGLASMFVLLALLAWVVAMCTAVLRAMRLRGSWRWVFVLVAFLWLPALPVLLFGASGALAIGGHGRGAAHA